MKWKIIVTLLIVSTPASTRDACESFYDVSNNLIPRQSCHMYCCGSCHNRYCCSDAKYRLHQDECFEYCESYFDAYENYIPAKKCIKEARFCCGTCHYRDCCPYYLNRLDQDQCYQTDTDATQFRNGLLWALVVIGSVLFLTITTCLCVFIYKRNKSCLKIKLDRSSNGRRASGSDRVQSVYAERYSYDPPPTYESLKYET